MKAPVLWAAAMFGIDGVDVAEVVAAIYESYVGEQLACTLNLRLHGQY